MSDLRAPGAAHDRGLLRVRAATLVLPALPADAALLSIARPCITNWL